MGYLNPFSLFHRKVYYKLLLRVTYSNIFGNCVKVLKSICPVAYILYIIVYNTVKYLSLKVVFLLFRLLSRLTHEVNRCYFVCSFKTSAYICLCTLISNIC